MKCFADSVCHEVEKGVYMSYGCSFEEGHTGPHSFEWVEVMVLLRNPSVYRKRKNQMELRNRAADVIEGLAQQLRVSDRQLPTE